MPGGAGSRAGAGALSGAVSAMIEGGAASGAEGGAGAGAASHRSGGEHEARITSARIEHTAMISKRFMEKLPFRAKI